MPMFTVLSSWQSHCESSPGSFDECRTAPRLVCIRTAVVLPMSVVDKSFLLNSLFGPTSKSSAGARFSKFPKIFLSFS